MAGLRVFVSSTCYDLSAVRGQLRVFLQSLGHDPVMSDFNDVLYDPRVHTHTSCVDEVASCDVVVLIVGSRYGGKSFPEALATIDFEQLQSESKSVDALKDLDAASVTQLEILKAVEQGLPVFTFVDERVWHDHALYEKNKNKPILSEITFPSIEKPETARFIFEFINFLRHRTRNNSVFPFGKVQDIEETLRRQWSSLFQRLLNEQRQRESEARRIDVLTEQFADLKTAILTTIGSSNEREVARGVVRFRRLVDFVRALGLHDDSFVLRERHSWEELLERAGIVDVVDAERLHWARRSSSRSFAMQRSRLFLLKGDETFYEVRVSIERFNDLSLDWAAWCELAPDSRAVIIDALSEMVTGPGIARYVREPFGRYLDSIERDTVLTEIENSDGRVV
ncbi:MAG: DUF4062 domain-containing protein [Actinobacteria bacterium]|nr:DUF4062 domain-containing protein [Actinomycetota bacterium]